MPANGCFVVQLLTPLKEVFLAIKAVTGTGDYEHERLNMFAVLWKTRILRILFFYLQSVFPPVLSMGLPLRHHIVVYLLAQANENQEMLQSRLKFHGGEVDATAWVDETVAAVVARSDDFGQLMKVPQRYFW